MEAKIKEQLPGTLRALVDEIETAAGSEIEVRCGVSHSSQSCPGGMAADINFGDPVCITVFCPQGIGATRQPYPTPYAEFCHELLHLRRTFIEKVPAIFQIVGMVYGPVENHPVYEAWLLQTFSVRGLETALEHIIIEPQVSEYGIEHIPCLIGVEAWNTVPSRPWAYEYVQRWACMDAWIKTQFLTPYESARVAAERVMERVGLLGDARRLTDRLRILRSMPNSVPAKEAMCVAACEAFQIEPSKMGLLYHRKTGVDELLPLDSLTST